MGKVVQNYGRVFRLLGRGALIFCALRLWSCAGAWLGAPRSAVHVQLPPREDDGFVAPDAQGWGEAAGLRFLERVRGGGDPREPLPLFVMLHGLGDRPSEDWFADLEWPVRVVLPQAPLPEGTGFAWFKTRVSDRREHALAAEVRDVGERVARLLDALRRRRPTRGRAILAGFSQGAIVTYQVALTHPEVISVAHPVAAMLPKELWPTAPVRSGPMTRIRAAHGTTDEIIPIEKHRALADYLKHTGHRIELTEFPEVAHELGGSMDLFMHEVLMTAFWRAPP